MNLMANDAHIVHR